MSDAV